MPNEVQKATIIKHESKMTLTKRELIDIFQGLQFMQQMPCSAKGSYAINKNLRLLLPVVRDVQDVQRKMIEEIPNEYLEKKDGGIKILPQFMDEPACKKYIEENNKFLEDTDEIDLHKFNGSELLPVENKIPSGVLGQLFPILNEE